jgi:cold shock CspA family protein
VDSFSRRVAAKMCSFTLSAVERAVLSTLNEGQTVEYQEASNRGKTSAENLRVQR